MNTWDFPFYLLLIAAALVYGQYRSNGWNGRRIVEFFLLCFGLGIPAILMYFPFFLSFSSQAGGILPSLAFLPKGITSGLCLVRFFCRFLPACWHTFLNAHKHAQLSQHFDSPWVCFFSYLSFRGALHLSVQSYQPSISCFWACRVPLLEKILYGKRSSTALKRRARGSHSFYSAFWR